jgi:DNA-directed RNA polymerase specialized sigma24 family protein
VTELDALWRQVCFRDERAFGDWMGRVERPIRLALFPWARIVDAECIVQETLMRMWVRANDAESPPLEGENASLRFAIGVAKNLARNESRKRAREDVREPGDVPELAVEPDPAPDPALRRAIRECMEKLASRPAEALRARLERGHVQADREIAAALRMGLNAFLQNITRARRQMAACLEGRGVPPAEIAP